MHVVFLFINELCGGALSVSTVEVPALTSCVVVRDAVNSSRPVTSRQLLFHLTAHLLFSWLVSRFVFDVAPPPLLCLGYCFSPQPEHLADIISPLSPCLFPCSVMFLQFVPKTHLFFTAGKDKKIKQWDADKFEHIQTLEVKPEIWGHVAQREGSPHL